MGHADTTSGAVPLWARDTAPCEPGQTDLPVPTAPLFRRVTDTAVEDTVSPPREARSTDASKLTFPVQMMIAAILMTATIIGAVYGLTGGIRESQAQMQSDIRDMRTRMELQAEIDRARNEARGVEQKATNAAVDDLRRLTQLLQIQYNELRGR